MWLEITWFFSFLTIFGDLTTKMNIYAEKQPKMNNYSSFGSKLYILMNIYTKKGVDSHEPTPS